MMHCAFLVGPRMYLRPLEEGDLTDEYRSWLNDPDVTRYMRTGKWPVTPASLRRYWERFQTSTTDIVFAMVVQENDRFIGTVALNNIDWIYRTADTGIMIGNKEFWGKGYAFEAWSLLMEYAFTGLDLRKVVAGAAPGNAASVRALEKLGLQREGVLRQHALVYGTYIDSFLFGLLRNDFREAQSRK